MSDRVDGRIAVPVDGGSKLILEISGQLSADKWEQFKLDLLNVAQKYPTITVKARTASSNSSPL